MEPSAFVDRPDYRVDVLRRRNLVTRQNHIEHDGCFGSSLARVGRPQFVPFLDDQGRRLPYSTD